MASLLGGCTATSQKMPNVHVATLYDYQLLSSDGEIIAVDQLVAKHQDADVFMVGEFHAHPAVHLFQAKLLAHVAGTKRGAALSMEQFTRADQAIVSQYVAGEIGESTLIKKAKVWDNYKSDYRPLLEIARHQGLPVVAANAPRDIVKCIGRQGPQYIDKLSSEQRTLVAKNIDISDSPYRQKFLSNMRGMTLSEERIGQMFGAQMTWDATMAESIVKQLDSKPEQPVVHVAGRFHVMDGLGTGAEILKLRPQTKIVYISAVNNNEPTETDDYRLMINDLPPMWINDKERGNVMAMHKRSKINCL